jgi:3-oxoadipate enol-lactonase
MRTIELSGGVALQVEDAGEGPAIVLLHAGVSNRHMWDRQWAWLRQNFRVVRWDWRGYGVTPFGPEPYSYAADVLAVMNFLDLARATLVGASMGGAAAIRVALDHPERVERLVLVGSAVHGLEIGDPVPPICQEMEAAEQSGDTARVWALEEQTWLIGPDRRADDVDPAYLERARVLHRAGWQTGVTPPPGLDDQRSDVERLGELTVPVLVVVGASDTGFIREAAARLAERLPQVEYHVFDDVAHLPSLEKPRQFDAVLADWLAETAPRDSFPEPEAEA